MLPFRPASPVAPTPARWALPLLIVALYAIGLYLAAYSIGVMW